MNHRLRESYKPKEPGSKPVKFGSKPLWTYVFFGGLRFFSINFFFGFVFGLA